MLTKLAYTGIHIVELPTKLNILLKKRTPELKSPARKIWTEKPYHQKAGRGKYLKLRKAMADGFGRPFPFINTV
jgi:hypothetical protein